MHLLVDISSHGLGHLAQTAPVLQALRLRLPELQLTVRSGLPLDALRRRIADEFDYLGETRDFGFVMHNAMDIDLVASALRYREFHQAWARRITTESAWLQQHRIDAVLSNVAYLPLAGAAGAGIPAAALCSLNWADLFEHYFHQHVWAREIHGSILAAYNAANCFLRVTPGMPMSRIAHRTDIPPIARLGAPDRNTLANQLNLNPTHRWILVAMGGMDFPLAIDTWPRVPGHTWLVAGANGFQREDVRAFDSVDMHFTDMLASVDAVITKPGYGTFVEAACNGIPLLYLQRDDWPETQYLETWLTQHARATSLTRECLNKGDFMGKLEYLWQSRAPLIPQACGAAEAAEHLIQELSLR